MPITAQNTASCVTRGLVSAMYWEIRLPGVWERVVLSMRVTLARHRAQARRRGRDG